ncbi:hypothetical protein SDC9_163803 [bioreactor metagenome]|uniref:Uncharacterized protein n=1 Tax=bioreactor metagenome TaxID=1076179 RepID=A0A645FSQ5_9ZZZZ
MQSYRRVFRYSKFLCDGVGCFESDSNDVIGKPIGVSLDHRKAILAIGSENEHRAVGAHPMILEKKHDILDLFLLQPTALDLSDADLADATDQKQLADVMFKNGECIGSEDAHNLFGQGWAYALDQA